MPRSSVYYSIENNPVEIAEAHALIEVNDREYMGLILASKNEILRKVINVGVGDDPKPKERLAI